MIDCHGFCLWYNMDPRIVTPWQHLSLQSPPSEFIGSYGLCRCSNLNPTYVPSCCINTSTSQHREARTD